MSQKIKEKQDRKQQLKEKRSMTTAKTIEELKDNAEKQQHKFELGQDFLKKDSEMNEVVDEDIENSAKTFYKEFKKV